MGAEVAEAMASGSAFALKTPNGEAGERPFAAAGQAALGFWSAVSMRISAACFAVLAQPGLAET